MAQRGRPRKQKPVSDPKGVVPKEKTDAQLWLEKIGRAQRVRQEWRDQMRVSVAYDYFEGRQRPSNIPYEEWITINMIYSTLLAELPALYSTDPYFYVKVKKSYKPDRETIVLYEEQAQIRQSALNYYKGELELKPKARLSIFDAFFQYGVFKVHLSADLADNPDAGKVMLGEDDRPQLDEETGEPILQPDVIPTNEMFRLTRIHPDDYLVDEDAGPLDEDVNWNAQRIKMSIHDFIKDKRFPKSVRGRVKPTEMNDKTQKEREQKKKGSVYRSETKTPDTVVLWEVYDRKEKKFLTVADGHTSEFVISPREIPKGIEDDPFVDLRLTLRGDSWYPLPPVSQMIDPQREYCDVRSKMLKHRKRFNRKYVMFAAAFSQDAETQAAKLENGDDGTVLIADATVGFDPVLPIKDAPLDQQVHTEYAYLRKDFEDIAQGANQRGAGTSVDSATEAGIIEKRTMVREGDRLSLVGDFVTKIGRKLDQLIEAHMTKDMAIRISGPEGEKWVTVGPENYKAIEGEFEYSINVGATTPQLPEIERAQWMAFLGLIANAPQLLLSKALLKESAKLHHIENEMLVEELYSIGQMFLSGQLPMPGQQGSQPGTPGTAAARGGGAAGGSANVPAIGGGMK